MTAAMMLRPNRSPLLRDRAAAAAARGSWPLMIGLAAYVAAAALLMAPVVTATSWVPIAAISSTAVLAAAQLARQLTGSTAAAAIASYLTAFIAAVLVAAPESILDIFPVIGRRIGEFAAQVPSDLPPLRESPGVTLVAVIVALLIAVITDLLAFGLRAPGAALLPAVVFPAITIGVGQPPAPWLEWVLVVGLAMLVLFIGARWRRRNEDEARAAVGYTADGRGAGGLTGAALAGIASIALAGLVATLLPAPSGALWQHFAPVSTLSTSRVNPIIDLGDDLRRNAPTEVLKYATSQVEGQLPYLSLISLSELTADSEWSPAPFNGDGPLPSSYEIGPPTNLGPIGQTYSAGSGGDVQHINVILNAGVTAYLPHMTTQDYYGGVIGEYRRDNRTGDIRQLDAEPFAQNYHLETVLSEPSADELATLTPPVGGMDEFLALPDDPALDAIRAAMNQIIDPNASPYQQALQLQQWFTGGAFDYSEQAPVSGGYDGTSLGVIVKFLEMRSGYCVHFASAMAVMGRLLDIPTRIQVGFTPGTFTSVNDAGQPVYSVSSDDLHAWAEFWVEGYGWVAFETTPADGLGEMTVPPLGTEGDGPNATESVPPTETDAAGGETPTPTDGGGQESPTPTEETDDANKTDGSALGEGPSGLSSGVLIAVGIAILALAIIGLTLAAPGFLRRRLRKIRQERVEQADLGAGAFAGPDRELHPAAAAWREVEATAVDHGLALTRSTVGATVASFASKLKLDDEDAALAALERLASQRDHAAFGDPDAALPERPDWADVETVTAAIVANATAQQQRRARNRPPSVLVRKRRRRRLG